MTDTINSVPRELLERIASTCMNTMPVGDREAFKTLLSATSPAGVDGLEVVAVARNIRNDDPYGLFREIPVFDTKSRFADGTKLVTLDGAQAIIDGLRGEVERLCSQKADWVERATALGQMADQQTETIANYKSQFSELHAARNLLSRLSMAGFELGDDAAASVIAKRDQQARRIGELERLLTAERNKVPLYEAVERACGDLPEGWKVELHMENGAAWIELYDAEGIEVENFPTNIERLDYTINDAIDAALSAGKEGE